MSLDKLIAFAVLAPGSLTPAQTPYSSRCAMACWAHLRCCTNGQRRRHWIRASVAERS